MQQSEGQAQATSVAEHVPPHQSPAATAANPAAHLPLAALPPACPPRVQPLTLASIGRRLWIKYRFTNKRLVITTSSPVLQREVQVRQGIEGAQHSQWMPQRLMQAD